MRLLSRGLRTLRRARRPVTSPRPAAGRALRSPARGKTEDVDGVRQSLFTVDRSDGPVPAVLWTSPETSDPRPLVLIGHGGGGHKLDANRQKLARQYVLEHGCVAAAIDAPRHGERQSSVGREPKAKIDILADQMVSDWSRTLDWLVQLPEVDASRVGYGGVSMGTMFGLPFAAADERVRAAVFGLCGLTMLIPNRRWALANRLEADAARLTIPVLFMMMEDDSQFPSNGAQALFDAIGSPDKRLLTYPGDHGDAPEESRTATTAFLAKQLAPPGL